MSYVAKYMLRVVYEYIDIGIVVLIVSYCLFFSPNCYSTENMNGGKHINGLYMGLQYYGDLGITTGTLSGTENTRGVHTSAILGFDATGNSAKYDPSYISDYLAGGISIGIPFNKFRFEVELQYSNIEVDDEGFTDKSQVQYIELQRDDIIDGPLESGTAKSELLSNKYAYSIGSTTNPGTGVMPNSGSLTATDHLATKFTNRGFKSISALINASHDIVSPFKPLIPFISIGAGIIHSTFLGNEIYGISYQCKVGARYYITKDISIQSALNYRGNMIKEYKDTIPDVPIYAATAAVTQTPALAPKENVLPSTSANFKATYGIYGIMVGVILEF